MRTIEWDSVCHPGVNSYFLPNFGVRDMGACARLIDWSDFKRNNLGGFPKDNEMGFFQEFCWKTISFVHTILGFDSSGWIVLIKSEILIKVGMVWPVRSDRWKAPLESRTHKLKTVYLNLFKGRDRFSSFQFIQSCSIFFFFFFFFRWNWETNQRQANCIWSVQVITQL